MRIILITVRHSRTGKRTTPTARIQRPHVQSVVTLEPSLQPQPRLGCGLPEWVDLRWP